MSSDNTKITIINMDDDDEVATNSSTNTEQGATNMEQNSTNTNATSEDNSTEALEKEIEQLGEIIQSADEISPECNSEESPLPSGKYNVEITECTTGRSDHTFVEMGFQVLAGAFKGMTETKNYHLTSKKARQFLQREFALLDSPVKKSDELPGACKSIVGKSVSISVSYGPTGNKAIFISGKGMPVVRDDAEIWED